MLTREAAAADRGTRLLVFVGSGCSGSSSSMIDSSTCRDSSARASSAASRLAASSFLPLLPLRSKFRGSAVDVLPLVLGAAVSAAAGMPASVLTLASPACSVDAAGAVDVSSSIGARCSTFAVGGSAGLVAAAAAAAAAAGAAVEIAAAATAGVVCAAGSVDTAGAGSLAASTAGVGIWVAPALALSWPVVVAAGSLSGNT
mmetsp:Transcript_10515/g.19905  ORF Transcript_10515/g.19905 Transcript_10515/m.19905 type:complete len:201 (-) Transcript_10515:739-1341(-)